MEDKLKTTKKKINIAYENIQNLIEFDLRHVDTIDWENRNFQEKKAQNREPVSKVDIIRELKIKEAIEEERISTADSNPIPHIPVIIITEVCKQQRYKHVFRKSLENLILKYTSLGEEHIEENMELNSE